MAKKTKLDGVIVAARYLPDGQVDWVRAYLRRGPTYSDHVLLTRQEVIGQIKTGKNFVVGSRVEFQASTFNIKLLVRVKEENGQEILVTGRSLTGHDYLEGVPRL
jgi:hypothetical protein